MLFIWIPVQMVWCFVLFVVILGILSGPWKSNHTNELPLLKPGVFAYIQYMRNTLSKPCVQHIRMYTKGAAISKYFRISQQLNVNIDAVTYFIMQIRYIMFLTRPLIEINAHSLTQLTYHTTDSVIVSSSVYRNPKVLSTCARQATECHNRHYAKLLTWAEHISLHTNLVYIVESLSKMCSGVGVTKPISSVPLFFLICQQRQNTC